MEHEMLFTVGQFAKLHHINKRTLHYYDEIGLFCPQGKGENGYRYYHYLQSPTLELLLALRELNMSLAEISDYMARRGSLAFHEMIRTKTAEIEETIDHLQGIRQLLAEKEKMLRRAEEPNLDRLEVIDCREEYLLLSPSMTGTYDEADFAVFLGHIQTLRDHRLLNKSYGCMISAANIRAANFEDYDCFFAKVEQSSAEAGLFVKPAGRYLRGYCKGTWEQLPAAYGRICAFAATRGLTLTGPSYEEGLNEMAISDMAEYVTQISIACVCG